MQLLPQVPQSMGSLCRFAQWGMAPPRPPGHSVKPVAQHAPPSHAIAWHIPPTHETDPPAHMRPHMPQLFGSVIRSAHPLPHIIAPAAQVHMPPVQLPPDPHELPQRPQLSVLVARVTHPTFGQSTCPAVEQAQLPAMHVAPVPHAMLHPPQCAVLVWMSTHAPAHTVMPASHVTRTQFPPVQA
jgi:hypothetical protein